MHVIQMHLRLGERIFPDVARQQTASLLDAFQPELMNRLMNYEVVDGCKRSITGFPSVHFASLKDGFSLVGFGDAGKEVLIDIAGPLVRAWSDKLNRYVGLDMKNVACTIDRLPYSLTYRVPRMVVQKNKSGLQKLANADTGIALVEGLFLRSIHRQAEYLGITVPEDISVRFVGAEREFAARNGEGRNSCLGFVGATFETNLRLSGLWSVGRLLSKGYGLFNANLQLGTGQGQEEVADALCQ